VSPSSIPPFRKASGGKGPRNGKDRPWPLRLPLTFLEPPLRRPDRVGFSPGGLLNGISPTQEVEFYRIDRGGASKGFLTKPAFFPFFPSPPSVNPSDKKCEQGCGRCFLFPGIPSGGVWNAESRSFSKCFYSPPPHVFRSRLQFHGGLRNSCPTLFCLDLLAVSILPGLFFGKTTGPGSGETASLRNLTLSSVNRGCARRPPENAPRRPHGRSPFQP